MAWHVRETALTYTVSLWCKSVNVPKTAAKHQPLSRERILKVALELVDREGLAALSMRRVGEALGVEAMSLYHHVANKGALLDGIYETVLSELPSVEPSRSWSE